MRCRCRSRFASRRWRDAPAWRRSRSCCSRTRIRLSSVLPYTGCSLWLGWGSTARRRTGRGSAREGGRGRDRRWAAGQAARPQPRAVPATPRRIASVKIDIGFISGTSSRVAVRSYLEHPKLARGVGWMSSELRATSVTAMANRLCPLCGAEYLEWATECVDCGVHLVDLDDDSDPRDLPDEEQVIYELGGWTLDQRTAVAEAMAEAHIPHAWDDDELVVSTVHEATVDRLLEPIEQLDPDVVAADAAIAERAGQRVGRCWRRGRWRTGGERDRVRPVRLERRPARRPPRAARRVGHRPP